MNQAPTEKESKSYRAIKHLYNTAVDLMNQAPTKKRIKSLQIILATRENNKFYP